MNGVTMDNASYVRLQRKITEWEWYKDNVVKAFFLHCIIKAYWKDGKKRSGVEIRRGSFDTTQKQIEMDTGLSKHQIERAIKVLTESGEISTKAIWRKFTIITVNNYDLYQSDQPKEQQKPKTKPSKTDKEKLIEKEEEVIEETDTDLDDEDIWMDPKDVILPVQA